MRRTRQTALLGILSMLLSYAVAQPAYAAQPQPPVSATNAVTLNVLTAVNSIAPAGPRQGAPVKSYRWLLNLDNTGDPYGLAGALYCHPSSNIATGATPPAGGIVNVTYVVTQNGYPQGCEWPSIRYAVASPALSEGTQADWNPTLPLPAGGTFGSATAGLPTNCPTIAEPVKACKYLVTVMADGYQIGGVHFQVPNFVGSVSVYLNPYPIPLGTVRLKAFNDASPTDGTYDEATELGLVGFHGILNDVDGIIQADYYGNPLCTQYVTYQDTNSSAPGYTTNQAILGQIVVSSSGRPTPLPAKEPAPPDPVTGYYNPTVPGDCLSDTNGDITIPNMAPNHYSAEVTPPIPGATCVALLKPINADSECSTNFVQTTTLEGNHDFDVWTQPNDTGLDTELVVGGEPVPFVQFGFAHQLAQPAAWSCHGTPGTTSGCGRITGQLWQANTYVPGINALPGVGGANGTSGVKLQNPLDRGWVALNSLNAATGDFDQMVTTIPTQDPTRPGLHYPDCPASPTLANPTTPGYGCFEFSNIPDGEYMLTIWDEPQQTSLDSFNATISNGQIINMGTLPLLGWFSHVYGKVCVDTNANGRCDPGEKGIFHQVLQNLNRTNNSMVGGINTANTDNNGNYDFQEAYPLGLMSINQFFFTRFKTTGITYQSCNDPQEHTIVAPMVDVSYLPIIGQCGRLDWAVVPYSPSANGDNGGIVATQRDDYTRQKYNSRQAQTNDYQTGIPGFTFEQYTPVKGVGPGGTDYLSGYALNSDGSFCTAQGAKTNTAFPNCGDFSSPELAYISENNAPPAQCFPQDANGNPIGYVPGNVNSYDFMVSGGACIESSASGTQFGLGTDTPDASHPVQTVDGNYTLGNIPGIVPAAQLGDTLVKNSVPVDTVLPAGYCVSPAALGIPYEPPCKTGDTFVNAPRPLFRFTTEEDMNAFSGAQYIPQGANTSSMVWPPNPLPSPQMPNDLSKPDGGYDENPYTYSPGPDAICAGVTHVVHVTNPSLLANGGSPLEGTTRHLCDTKLLNVQAGQSIAPDFHVHTIVDIPLPAHFWGYIVDDVSVETNRKSYNLGEVHGIPAVPVGVYDWTGRRVASVNSDYNGAWEILMPSTDIVNCPTPAQVCPNVYRFVGNDPGQPAHPNMNYNPNYRTIAATFEAWPNMLIPADTAPTKIVTGLEGPGVQLSSTSPCGVASAEPQIFAIGPDPFTRATSTPLTISGVDFGPLRGAGAVRYAPNTGATPITLPVTSWGDHSITVRVGTSIMGPGSGTITVTNNAGLVSPSGIGFHVLGGNYHPHIVTVGPGQTVRPGVDFAADPFPQALTTLTAPIAKGNVTTISVHALPVSIGIGDTLRVTDSFGHTVDLAVSHALDPTDNIVPANPYPAGATTIVVDQSSASSYNFPTGSSVTLIRSFAIQDALDYAAYAWQAYWNTGRPRPEKNPNDPNNQWLVVVYPKWDPTGVLNTAYVPLGTYFESVIVHSPLKLQGVGPGGIYPDATEVQGSIIDGRFWSSIGPGLTDQVTPAADGVGEVSLPTPAEPSIVHWTTLIDYLELIGTGFTPGTLAAPVTEGTAFSGGDAADSSVGAVITQVGITGTDPTTKMLAAGIDGFTVTGGDQTDFPGNLSEVSGQSLTQFPEGGGETVGSIEVQGGAVFVNGGTDNYRLTDNLFKQNAGTYGAVRFGTEFQSDPSLSGGMSHNHNAVISRNLFVADGGTNLAGALGIFDDTNGYSVDHNTFCMNVSAEYGGAISHFGYSPNGSISYNRMFLNTAFDEGGAIVIGSEPGYRTVATDVGTTAVPDPNVFTQGTGAVTIDHNYIGDNLAQDDGGAMRIMGTAGSGPRGVRRPQPDLGKITLTDNVITNNVTAHEGGAISLGDAPVVDIVNNTISQNVSTATATTSDGLPAAAGIAVDINSAGLNTFLAQSESHNIPAWMNRTTWPNFSNARIWNDILWYNRAGSWAGAAGVAGIGMPGDTTAMNFWDVGSTDAGALLTVSYSVIGSSPTASGQQYIDGGGNIIGAPPTGGLCSNVPTDANSCAAASYNLPHLVSPYATILSIVQQRNYFRFRPAAIISVDLPPNLFDISAYRIASTSPAQHLGFNPVGSSPVPGNDIENRPRPCPPSPVDSGAYQLVPRAGGGC
jgi:hypothetical protein